MTDPERLIASGSELERSLLLAGANQKPSVELVTRMERGLGFAPGAGLASVAGSGLGAKLAALVLGAAVAGGGAAVFYGANSPSARPTPVAASVAAFADQTVAQAPAHTSFDVRSISRVGISGTDAADAERAADSARPTPKRQTSSRAGSTDRLSEEVAQLDRVRSALNAGNSDLALQLLDRYHQRFPNGALAPEARKLRQSASPSE